MKIGNLASFTPTETLIKPRIQNLTQSQLEDLKKQPTTLETQGIVYESTAIDFQKLSLFDLKKEKIDSNSTKITRVYSSKNGDEQNRVVVVRDPSNIKSYISFELSKENVNRLQQKFKQTDNFFERSDGTLRLNGEAEAFVAGWLENIRTDRHYLNADDDGNGLIEGDEAKKLTIGFESGENYDYIGKKITTIRLYTGNTYQELGRTPQASSLFETKDKDDGNALPPTKTSATGQYLSFENSIEKELSNTLKIDENLDGKISLDEGLSDKLGKTYRQNIINDTEDFHKDVLEAHPRLNIDTKLQNYDIGVNRIISQEEEMAMQEEMINASAMLSTFDILALYGTMDSYYQQMSVKETDKEETKNDTKTNADENPLTKDTDVVL